jgi:hypothetical protein
MKLWLETLPAKYQSQYTYLRDWCDVPEAEAREAIERSIREDIEFERRRAA